MVDLRFILHLFFTCMNLRASDDLSRRDDIAYRTAQSGVRERVMHPSSASFREPEFQRTDGRIRKH